MSLREGQLASREKGAEPSVGKPGTAGDASLRIGIFPAYFSAGTKRIESEFTQ